jgi:hypothetical protein
MAGYRSFLWSGKRGIVGHDVGPVADGQTWLSRINLIGKKAVRLRQMRAVAAGVESSSADRVRAARHHLRQAQRLLRALGESDLAEEAALLRDCVKQCGFRT